MGRAIAPTREPGEVIHVAVGVAPSVPCSATAQSTQGSETGTRMPDHIHGTEDRSSDFLINIFDQT